MNVSSVPAWRGFLFGLLAFACYSAGDVLVKKMSASYSVMQIFLMLQLVAVPIMITYVVREHGWRTLRSRAPLSQVGRGLLFTLQTFTAFYGFQHLPMAETYTFIFVMPVFTLLFAVMFLRERVTRVQAALILLAFAGVMIVFRPDAESVNVAALIVLGGSAVGGLSQVWMRRLAGQDVFGASLLYPVMTGAVVMGAFALPEWQAVPVDIMPYFIGGGIIAAAAHILIVRAFYLAPASQIAPTQYSQIIWGVLYGYIFFGDRPDMYVAVGAALIIFAGVSLARLEYRITHG